MKELLDTFTEFSLSEILDSYSDQNLKLAIFSCSQNGIMRNGVFSVIECRQTKENYITIYVGNSCNETYFLPTKVLLARDKKFKAKKRNVYYSSDHDILLKISPTYE